MVAAATRAAAAAGLADVEMRVLDAEAIDLADESFDAVVCRFGLMLIPDQAAVLAETRRVLRPGGRCAFAVWGEEDRQPLGDPALGSARADWPTSRDPAGGAGDVRARRPRAAVVDGRRGRV